MFKRLNDSFNDKISKKLLIFLLCLYLLVLIWVIMFHLSGYVGLDTYYHALKAQFSIPYRFGINRVYEYDFSSFAFWNDKFINILLFIPMGSLVIFKSFEKYSYLKCSLLGLFISTSFEVLQVFTRLGSFSYFDIICNLVGTLIGCFIFILIKNNCKIKTINYSMLTLTIIFVPVVLFGVISLCLNWDMFSVFFDFEHYPYIW